MHDFYYSWGKMGADGSLSMAIVNEHQNKDSFFKSVKEMLILNKLNFMSDFLITIEITVKNDYYKHSTLSKSRLV